MPSRRVLLNVLLSVGLVLAVAGIVAYTERWKYLPGRPIPVRVNRWTDRTEYLTEGGWVTLTNDPFSAVGDLQPKRAWDH